MVGAIHAALSFGLRALVALASHPSVQAGLKKALVEGAREVIRHATSSNKSRRVDKTPVNRA